MCKDLCPKVASTLESVQKPSQSGKKSSSKHNFKNEDQYQSPHDNSSLLVNSYEPVEKSSSVSNRTTPERAGTLKANAQAP